MEEEEEEVTDDERIYLARVDAGLPTLQSIDICLAYTVSESPPRAPAPSCTRSLVHPDLDLEIQISRSRSRDPDLAVQATKILLLAAHPAR